VSGHPLKDCPGPRANFMDLEALRHRKSIFEMIAVCHGEYSFQNMGWEPDCDPGSRAEKGSARTDSAEKTDIFIFKNISVI
jgi:hypothetical protein